MRLATLGVLGPGVVLEELLRVLEALVECLALCGILDDRLPGLSPPPHYDDPDF